MTSEVGEPQDASWMRRAIALARRAGARGEVPVGALLVRAETVLGRAGNRREASGDATAHAEVLAIRQACHRAGGWRLAGATLYVTLEPCAMCAGAMVLARVGRLVYGAPDPKAGASGSVFDVTGSPRLNHRLLVVGGVLQPECAALLSDFFKERRQHRAAPKR